MTQQWLGRDFEDPDLGAWEAGQRITERDRLRGRVETVESILSSLSAGAIGPSLAYSRLNAIGITGDQARQLLRTMSGQEDPTAADTTAADTTAADTTAADTDPGLPPGVPGWVDRSDFDISSLKGFSEVVAAIRNGDIGLTQGLNYLVSLGRNQAETRLALRNLFPDSTELGGGRGGERGASYGQDRDTSIGGQDPSAPSWAAWQAGQETGGDSFWDEADGTWSLAGPGARDMDRGFGPRSELGSLVTEEMQRAAALRKMEADPGQVFRSFLSQQPLTGQLSGLGQQALQSQYFPALQSFRAGVSDPTQGFGEWLRGGGQIMSPQDLRSQLGSIAGAFGRPEEQLSTLQKTQISPEMYGGNPYAFNAYLGNLEASVNPQFRGAMSGVAQNLYDRFMAETPGKPIMPWLARNAQPGGVFGF